MQTLNEHGNGGRGCSAPTILPQLWGKFRMNCCHRKQHRFSWFWFKTAISHFKDHWERLYNLSKDGLSESLNLRGLFLVFLKALVRFGCCIIFTNILCCFYYYYYYFPDVVFFPCPLSSDFFGLMFIYCIQHFFGFCSWIFNHFDLTVSIKMFTFLLFFKVLQSHRSVSLPGGGSFPPNSEEVEASS